MSPDEAMAIMNKYHGDGLYSLRRLFGECRTKADTLMLEKMLILVVEALGRERRRADIPEEHRNYGGPPKTAEAANDNGS